MHWFSSRAIHHLNPHLITLYLLSLPSSISALGINCRGSGLCPRATFNNKASASVIQVLRDVVWASSKPNSTTYHNGDHVICVSQSEPITISPSFTGPAIDGFSAGGSIGLSGSIDEGGVCLFPQDVQGGSITLGQIRPLTDAILNHKCTTCGSVPIHYVDESSNDPSDGILIFNYVSAPTCDGNCISDLGSPDSGQGSQQTEPASSAAPSSNAGTTAAPSSSPITSGAVVTSTSIPVSLVTVTQNSLASTATGQTGAGSSVPSQKSQASLMGVTDVVVSICVFAFTFVL